MLLPVYDERGGAFAQLRDRRVLIYWPHGLGDFVHLSTIVPLLEPSNSYFITRFGDDYVHLYDRGEIVTPIYSGLARPELGRTLGRAHFGIDYRKIRNRSMSFTIPEPLRSRVKALDIDTLLYTDYPECEGNTAFPFQTKARALARDLVAPERLATLPLDRPLRSSLELAAPAQNAARVRERLRRYVEPAQRLVLVASGCHTFPTKTWPDNDVEAFARLIRQRDPNARVVAVDERTSACIGSDRSFSTTEDMFADLGIPFAHVLLTLLREADAFVGVASGPLHTALAMGGRPIVGIWLAHHPDWYDELGDESIHILGPIPCKKMMDRRKATTTRPPELRARVIRLPDRSPNARDVHDALDLFR